MTYTLNPLYSIKNVKTTEGNTCLPHRHNNVGLKKLNVRTMTTITIPIEGTTAPQNTPTINVQEPLDLRNYIFSAGYYFGEENFIQLEPSVMVQFRESTGQRIADFNLKAYKTLSETQVWAALSYRRSFDSSPIDNSEYVTPVVGINYQNFMFSYTYTKQTNDIVLTNSGFHQVTLGINLWTREQRGAACPNINSNSGRF